VTPTRFRVAVLGVSHWHLSLYLDPLMQQTDVRVVGISDPDPAVALHHGRRLACDFDTDFRALCERCAPEFVFALGRHCDMAEEARFLIDRGIPFALEKPCGLNEAEVAELHALASAKGAFAAVPLVWRQTEMTAVIERSLTTSNLHYLGFRLIAGPPQRYLDAGCAWMLDPVQSGGGCTLNLGVHFMDLFAYLTGASSSSGIEVVDARMTSVHGYPVEDHSVVQLHSAGAVCLVETGYLYPAPTGTYDMHFSFMADETYFVARSPTALEIVSAAGDARSVPALTTNVPYYARFVADVLRRCRDGKLPLAGLGDMKAAFRLLTQAYDSAEPMRT
jgi:predicted dehydrogenase